MRSMKVAVALILLFMLSVTSLGCSKDAAKTEKEPEEKEIIGRIVLATTTSTQDSGLLDEILPFFTKETGYEVDVIAVGSGKAMQMGMDGEADVLLVHSPAAEKQFVEEGHGPARYDVMYNDFVVIGPKDDPAGVEAAAPKSATDALKKIADANAVFVSRGDDSGTHKKELDIWKKLNITPAGDWYVSAGKGMSEVVTMANEMKGYTISDRATWLDDSKERQLDLQILTEGDTDLFNQYGVIVVDPKKNSMINEKGAVAFQDWILSEKIQKLIGKYGVEKYGKALFTPNAK